MIDAAKPLVLIADDDSQVIQLLETLLHAWGFTPISVTNKADLLKEIHFSRPALVILDLEFGPDNGIDLTAILVKQDPELAVILLTGYGSIDVAVEAIRRGAYDFLTKPVNNVRLRMTIERALEQKAMRGRIDQLEQIVEPGIARRRIRGNSAALGQLKQQMDSIAATDVTVLIQGESGTGKELVAHALHEQSPRRDHPFIAMNMAALPRELAESMLFGHEKGGCQSRDALPR